MQNTKVSTIIPTYKRSEMLPRAIDSVLNQTYRNLEILVVDDNDPSSDYRKATESIMKKYELIPEVKYIRHEKNMNGAAARNTGIFNSSGDVLCFLDDDDWFFDNKIEIQLEYLLKNSNYQAVYCGWKRNNKVIIPEKVGNLSYGLLSGESLVYTNTIMIWKDIACEIGGWNPEFKRNQEAVFLLRLFKKGYEIGLVPEVLVGFDTSDRSNVLCPTENKKLYEFYLSYHEDIIKELESEIKGVRKKIYTKRNTGILLNYLKEKELYNAFKHYIDSVKQFPIQFNKEIIHYTYKRLLGNNF